MTQRSHYRERAVGAMSELLDHYLHTRQWEPGVRLAIRLLGSDPLQERAHRNLMQLYNHLKRPADAMRQYRQCRRILSRELGVGPEPETQRLYREISQTRARGVGEAATGDAEIVPRPATDSDCADIGTTERSDTPGKPDGETLSRLRRVTVLHIQLSRYQELSAEDDPEGRR